MLLLPTLLSLLAITTTTVALNPQPLPPGHLNNPLPLRQRDSCAPNYVKCAPPGATGTSIPVIGPSVKGLYLNVLESVQGDKLRLKKKDWVNIFEEDFNGMSLDFNVGTEKRPMVGTLEKMKRQAGIDVGGRVDAAVEVDTDTDEQSNGSADSSIKLGLRQISDTDNLKKMTRQVDVKGEIVHCSDDSFNGLIVIGCTPVDLSPEKRSRMEKAERVKRRAGIDVGVNLPVPADVDPTLEEFELRKRTTTVQMCCAVGTQCLLLKDFNVPFCWDKFTTNFFLPFSSYGSLTTGHYTSPAPPNAPPNTPSDVNLLSGNYTRPDGSSGNIYSEDEAAKPDTATLGSLMPTPWTSTGVGSAIPASALGGIATWTTVIEGTTVEASVVSGSTVVPGTTVPAVTTTVTGFEETATSTGTASSTSSKGVAASGGRGAEEWVTAMAVAVAGLLCAALGL